MKVNKTGFCTPLPLPLFSCIELETIIALNRLLYGLPQYLCVCVCVCVCVHACVHVCVLLYGVGWEEGGLVQVFVCVPVCVRRDEKNTKEIL